jgi:signal transduction histidine kinase
MDTSLFYDTKNDIGGHMMLLYEASDIYAGTGAYAKSLAHYKMHSKLKDSILNVKRLGKINELEIKYKTELKDAQIKKLVILLIFAILLIVSILFVTKVFQLKKTKQKNLELKAAYNKQVLLEKELTEVRENIAQDFHDDLGNKLARISLLSNLVSEDDSVNNLNIKSKVKQITEDANGLYTGTRDFIFSLKPNSEYLKEVITYLSDFGEDFFSKTKVNFTIKKNVNKNVKLPYYWNRQLVYIFKEALTNALKHSKGDKVVLAFNCENDVLKISCIDNGIGLKEHSLSSLNGMSNMKKRARKIGGELIVKSGKNNGTTISFMGKIKQGNTYEA